MRLAALCAVVALVLGCSPAPDRGTPDTGGPAASASAAPSPSPSTVTARPTTPATATPPRTAPLGTRRPPWLGRRVLPRTPEGYGEVRPTPTVLRRRQFPTIDVLPPPAGRRFESAVRAVPRRIVQRSTWSRACPVDLGELRYVTVSFHGFDGRPHTGELLVNAAVAHDIVEVFRALYRARFPIEEMRVVDRPELDLPPTGDGNNTTAFVCRPSRSSTSWSQHAFGLAIDVNPFFNPYVNDEVVLPELASYFTDRTRRHPGMHRSDGTTVRAFARIGWQWGGDWDSLKDYMHFSANGR